MRKTRKALNFDLDTRRLKQYYRGNRSSAYKAIKKFLCENGFTHRQFSGYNSIEPMSKAEVDTIILKLSVKFPWLKKCVNRFDVTDIGRQHDLIPIITGEIGIKVKEKVLEKEQNRVYFSRAKLHECARQIQQREREKSRQDKSKDNDLTL